MSILRPLVVVAAAGAAGILYAGPALAGPLPGRTTTEVSCAGQTLSVSSPPGNDGNNWGAVQVSAGGHLVVRSLEYAVHDDTTGAYLKDELLAHGRAHTRQDGISCLVASEQARLADVVPDGTDFPPGTAPTDIITMSLRAVVVPRP